MAQIAGVWNLTSSENFDELMKELGVGLLTRKIGATTKPTVTLNVNGDNWEMVTESAIKTHKMQFKLNEEANQETIDGRKVKTTFTLDGNKLIQTEKDRDNNNVLCVISRELNDKGELVVVAKAGDVVSTRVYNKK